VLAKAEAHIRQRVAETVRRVRAMMEGLTTVLLSPVH
jgi:hypothetical protein